MSKGSLCLSFCFYLVRTVSFMETKPLITVIVTLCGIAFINTWVLNQTFPFYHTIQDLNVKGALQSRDDTWHNLTPSPFNKAKLHLIIQFPVITETSSPRSNSTRLMVRQKEYTDTLRRNLMHPLVSEVHVLYESVKDKDFIQSQNLAKLNKLRFYHLGRRLKYKDAFEYASLFLQGKITVIINADCYIGNGFEKLEENILRHNVLYALTRHESTSSKQNCSATDFCGPGEKYIGSHDAFVFQLSSPVPKDVLERINFRSNIVSIERVLIYNLRQYGNFTVRNPCKILHIVHNHCSKYRIAKDRFIGGEKLRLDKHLKMGGIPFWKFTAPFSDL